MPPDEQTWGGLTAAQLASQEYSGQLTAEEYSALLSPHPAVANQAAAKIVQARKTPDPTLRTVDMNGYPIGDPQGGQVGPAPWWGPYAGAAAYQMLVGPTSTASGYEPMGPTRAQLGLNGNPAYAYRGKRRRRRRRLLTCSDKADIAFLHGQLGGGQLGRAAISALLSRRCG